MKRGWLLFLLACAPTETGNPARATMALVAHSSDLERVALAEASAVIVDEAWVGLGDVRFVLAEECDAPGDTAVQLEGPFVASLLDPRVRTFDAATDDYCRVRVQMRRVDVGGPPGLLEHALFVRGRLADGTPFELQSRVERELDVRADGPPFRLDSGRRFLLSFDVARWLGELDFTAALRDPDGTVRISDESNRDLSALFEERLRVSLELYDDRDADGRRSTDDSRLAASN